MDAAVRYWAFLIYLHRDWCVTERLCHALETWRMPRRLIGRSGPLCLVPARLTPIFRARPEPRPPAFGQCITLHRPGAADPVAGNPLTVNQIAQA